MSENTTKISCRCVCKTFIQKGTQHVHVLEGIDLEVRENELLVLLGPGQSGKSTLLRIIAGLETPSTGQVLLNGAEVAGPGPDRSMVFQTYSLFPWRTVQGNVEMGLKFQGIPKEQRRKIAQKYIDLVGLTGFERSFPHQLSGGMKQRVGIARAYANNPEVLLLDEPFGQLDAQTRYLMEQEIVRIWEQEKKTVLFVTNNIDEAIYIGDRIVVLEGKLPGRLHSTYEVNLPRPRDHADIAFLELRRKITDATELTLLSSELSSLSAKSRRPCRDSLRRAMPGDHHLHFCILELTMETNKNVVATDKAPAAIGPYSQGRVSKGLLFTSGQLPLDPLTGQLCTGSLTDQAHLVFRNLAAIANAAGTSLANAVKTTVYLQDINDFKEVNGIYGQYFPQPYPARSAFQVAALPLGARLEVEAVIEV